jgi:hypothetical protein
MMEGNWCEGGMWVLGHGLPLFFLVDPSSRAVG